MVSPPAPTPDGSVVGAVRGARGLPFAVRISRRLGIALGLSAATWLMLWLLDGLVHGARGWANPVEPMLTAALIGLAVLGYLGWPSRWNIPAHMQLAFAVTAYFIPTVLGSSFSVASPAVLAFYAAVIIVGFAASLIGAAVGAELRVPRWADLTAHAERVASTQVAKRVLVVVVIATLALAACFAVMGFVPAFVTADPLNAKFFRGDYAARYAPVAAFYRGAVSVLVILMPAVTMYAAWRRRWYWLLALAASVFLLVCTLQRGNAIAGAILFAGVAFARLRRRAWSYAFFLALVVVYGFGSASFALLRMLGIGSFSGAEVDTSSIAAVVAAGAPDVADQLSFAAAWLQHPEYTYGLTFIGGLVPYHFVWNPAVWTLHIQQPDTPLGAIASGGLRLPAPLWGFVSFGWPGVVLVGALSGLLIGFAGAAVRRVVELRSREHAVMIVVLYAAIIDVVGQFYILSYTSVFELLLLGAVMFAPRWRLRARRRVSRPMGRGEPPAAVTRLPAAVLKRRDAS